jgi:putative ABC transport system substrate-binding protein
MNTRRQLLIAIGAAPFLSVSGIQAQQASKLRRIGYIGGPANKEGSRQFTVFRDELQRLGYADGKSVVFDYRAAEGQLGRIPGLVEELVKIKVDVLIAPNIVAIRAAQRATTTIPIVMVASLDPVAEGFVKSLRQPGGNITGISMLRGEMTAKRVELLKDLVPNLARVAILWDADGPGPRQRAEDSLAAARALSISALSLQVKAPTPDFESAFKTARASHAQALFVLGNPFMGLHQKTVAALAAQHGLPSIGEDRSFVAAGGLVSYGEDLDEQPKVVASYVARILKGAKPADLPIQQPTKFELFVNLKTAKTLGITIPPAIMVRADQVIQ